jgi:hypothetical protein
MNKSETIAKLAEALSRAQAEMHAAKFNAVNPFLKNHYADLGSIIDTAKPVLGKFGLAVTQLPYNDGDRVGVETVLTHASGEWISASFSLPSADEKGKSGAQVAGSIITYLRRYSLAAILGMYSDEDTDGNDQPKPELKPHEAKPAEKPVESETMTIEDACKTTTSEGKPYGEMAIVGLEKMLSAMHAKLAKNELTPEETAEVERKIKAAQMVHAAKVNKEI